jgi:hypothetical protein
MTARRSPRVSPAAAHGKGGQRVLEYRLEGEELQQAQVHGGVESQAALVWADGAVHLDPESPVDLELPLIVDPRNAEHDHALELHDAFEDLGLGCSNSLSIPVARPELRVATLGCR